MTTQGESTLGSIQLQESWDRDVWSPSAALYPQQDIYIALAELDQKIKTLRSRAHSEFTCIGSIRVLSPQERIEALETERIRLLAIVKEIRKTCNASEWPETEVQSLVLPTNDDSPDKFKPELLEVGKRHLPGSHNSSYPVGSIIKPNPAIRAEAQSHNVDGATLQKTPLQNDSTENNSSEALGFTTMWVMFAFAVSVVKNNKTTLTYYETLKVWFLESTGTILTWAIYSGIAVAVIYLAIWFAKKPDDLEKNDTDSSDTSVNKIFIDRLFSGNFGLARTFWLLYFIPKIPISMALNALPALPASPVVFLLIAFEVACCIAVWRAASSYQGLAFWKWTSKFLVSLVLFQDLLAIFAFT